MGQIIQILEKDQLNLAQATGSQMPCSEVVQIADEFDSILDQLKSGITDKELKRFYENKLIYGHILEEIKNSQFGL